MNRTVAGLNAFKPDYLIGYTTALRSLATEARRGALNLFLDGIVASGEVLSEEDTTDLEATFGCEVRNLYACSEMLWMGLSVHGSSAVRLYDDDLIYEFQDDHFYVTNLFNFTQPLIRYRIDDVLGQPRPSPTTPYLEVSGVLGRTERPATFINEGGVPEDLNGMSLPVFFQNRVMRC
jgi:phenylacetate-CoA ligase